MRGSLHNRLMDGRQYGELTVGCGATELCYTDRRAYTVQKIISDRRIVVTRDKVKRIDANGPSDAQVYEYESTPLIVGERALRCTNPYRYLIQEHGCSEKKVKGTCAACAHYRMSTPTNGITLIRTKRGWKQMGADTYFAVGIRDEHYDYSF